MAFSYGLSLNTSFVKSIQNLEHIKQYMHIPSEAPTIIEHHRPPDNGEIRGNMEYLAQTAPYRQEITLCTSSN